MFFCLCNLVKNQWISVRFSLLDLRMNDAHKGINFALLTWLMFLHYLVKVEALKMHANHGRETEPFKNG